MNTAELHEQGLSELSAKELMELRGGEDIAYLLAYDLGFLIGTATKVGNKIVQALFMKEVLTPVK